MKICGLICEFNPLHNGHRYLINNIKKEYDTLICVMSGEFVQRGDITVFDKWTRANMALNAGCDLIVELPVCYALNSAERFSFGGVSILDKTNVVDSLCFGSESGDIEELINASRIINNETDEISDKIKLMMDDGFSYPKSRAIVYKHLIGEELLEGPNNILGIEYINSINKLNSNIKPITCKRYIAKHNDIYSKGEYASASAIRGLLQEGRDIHNFVPESAYNCIKDLQVSNINKLENVILYVLRTLTAEKISNISEVCEGLENRIIECAKDYNSYENLIYAIKTKRYTLSKIRRIIMNILLNHTNEIAFSEPEYLRVLGMNNIGIKVLSEIKNNSNLEIITKVADYKDFNKMFNLDIRSSDVYSLCYNSKNVNDFKNSPVILK